jgi:hypothetical protein
MKLIISNHAKVRMQQRGISKECIEHVIAFGKEYYRTGVFTYLMTKTALKELLRMGVISSQAADWKGVYVILRNGRVETVAHKHKRFKLS